MKKEFNRLAALALAAVMTVCTTGLTVSAEEVDNGLIVAIQSDPTGLDPHTVTDRAAGIAIENLYNTLFTYTETYGEAVPSLAESYEVSDDGLTYTLKLAEGVKFHSGNVMTSEDVKYSLERIQTSGARASQMEKISSIETPDENTVVITLSSQYAPFLTYLANPLNAIVEKAVVEENNGDINNVDAGTGPFMLAAWNTGSSVDMDAFEEYWEADKPKADTLQLKTITDATARATALRNGEIDMIIDGGTVDIGLESTIVDLTDGAPTILRPGYINQEMLTKVLGEVEMDRGLIAPESGVHPKAPGMKYRHYAPKADLIIVEGEAEKVRRKINELVQQQISEGKKVGVIGTDESLSYYKDGDVRSIGSRKDEITIAQHLFGLLREFDESDISVIYSEAFETPQIGQAIMNRLIKAAGHQIIRVCGDKEQKGEEIRQTYLCEQQ